MNNRIIKILIPIIAIVIIFESIMLVTSLNKNKVKVDKIEPIKEVLDKKEFVSPIIKLTLKSDVNKMKVGDTYKVFLSFSSKEDIVLDAFETYVKYDKQLLTISDLAYNKDIPTPTFTKISDKKDVIVSNFLSTKQEGMTFPKDEEINILTFSVTPKKKGNTSLEISTGDKEGHSITMFVDSTNNKALPISKNKLEIKLVN